MATTQQKPQLSALKTPLSASYPSELRSPLVATPTYIKQEESLKTPITPPAAYLDFLSKLSPAALMSPLSAGPATAKRFTFPDNKPALTSNASSDSISTTASMSSNSSTVTSTSLTSIAPATSPRPSSPLSKTSSRSSSCSSCHSDSQDKDLKDEDSSTTVANQGVKRHERPEPINTTAVPPTPGFPRPNSARTPRRLHIPQSPYSPSSVRSPLSAAATVYSPYSTAMSPRDSWDTENKRVGVSVRQVVTRTVTHYSRTPIVDPVPASKKRRTDSGTSLAASTSSSSTTSTE